MASGYVNRIKRPNTWLHRPMLQNVKKALANPEPSTHGTFETCRSTVTMSVYRGRAEVIGGGQTDANDRSRTSVSSLRVDHLCRKRPPRPKPSGANLEVTRFSLGVLLAFVSTPVQWAILDQPMAPGLCT